MTRLLVIASALLQLQQCWAGTKKVLLWAAAEAPEDQPHIHCARSMQMRMAT